jgi:hypothetical protein
MQHRLRGVMGLDMHVFAVELDYLGWKLYR